MLDKVPGKDVTVHVIAARVRMDMKVSFQDFYFDHRVSYFPVQLAGYLCIDTRTLFYQEVGATGPAFRYT